MARSLLFLLLCVLALPAAAAEPAQGSAAPAGSAASPQRLTAAEARHAIEVLQDPKRRAELIATLRAIESAAPTEKPPGSPMPAGKSAPSEKTVALAPDSLGAQLLSNVSSWPERLAASAAAVVQAITDFPLLWGWAKRFAADPAAQLAALNALWQVALVVVGALLLEALARWALGRPVTALETHALDGERNDGGAWPLLRRLPVAMARITLELVPVGVFWGAGSVLAGLVPSALTRAAVLLVIDAYAVGRVIMTAGRLLFSPASGRLRLLDLDDEQAGFLFRWLRRITGVAVIGGAGANLALLFGLSETAADTLIRAVGLVVAGLLAIVVLRTRRCVAMRLHAPIAAEGGAARWRNSLAATWHYLALIAIVAGWIIWAAGIEHGIGSLRILIGTVAILIAARLVAIVALGMLDRAVRLSASLPGAASRAARYQAGARIVATALTVVATAVVLLQVWGANAFLWFAPGGVGAKLISAGITIAVAALAAIVVWEGANAALEQRLARLSEAGPAAHSARLRTLLPILRASLLTTILAVVGLTALSEVGVNIAPLLAGAGIAGIAVGFGAQKLVQDVITGMFVLFENAIQIGDWVTVSGLSGSVERLSVRNIWLRGGDGAVHIIPFSAVTSITNTNRGLGNAAVSVTVGYWEDSDRVAGILSEIAADMRRDNAFAALMLSDLQLWVDAVKATGVTLAGLIACTDAGRWPVQHEFYRRMQKRLQELGIVLATG